MSDDDRRIDRDRNVWNKTPGGYYEKSWDFWNQRVERDDSDLEYRPDTYAADGTPLYQKRDRPSSQSSSSNGGDGAAALGILALVGLAIYGLFKGTQAAAKIFRQPDVTIYGSDKSPVVCALLSVVSFGCGGYFYLGQRKKGTAALIICLTLAPLMVGFLLVCLAAIDAYGTAIKLKQGRAVQEWEFSLGAEALPAYAVMLVVVVTIVLCAGLSMIFNGSGF